MLRAFCGQGTLLHPINMELVKGNGKMMAMSRHQVFKCCLRSESDSDIIKYAN